MTSTLFCLLALGAISLSNAQSSPAPVSYVDRKCGEDLSNLWLDVVIVVDNSKGMTSNGIISVAGDIVGVFGDGTTIGVRPDPRTTRVGLVTYNAQANINADLNKYQSYDELFDGVFADLGQVSSSDESYVANGLAAAEQVFEQGKMTNRTHYQKVVIVYASTYKGTGDLNPVPVADRLKASGATIITVAYNQNGDGALLADLSKIGTPHDNFANTDVGSLIGEIQIALMQANCFCPNDWTQYRSSFGDVYSYRYGVCIQPVGIESIWAGARMSCRGRWPNSFLASEFTADKHNYILSVVQNTTGFNQPYTYFIGLSLTNGKWNWEQPANQATIQQRDYSPWNPSYPIVDSTLTAVLNQQSTPDISTGWQNVKKSTGATYVCEVASCDTDNYCDNVGDESLAKTNKQ